MKTVKTAAAYRRATRRRDAFRWTFKEKVVMFWGRHHVEIRGLVWEPEDGFAGSWERETLDVRFNGRRIKVVRHGSIFGRWRLPKVYGFTARIAFSHALDAMNRSIW